MIHIIEPAVAEGFELKEWSSPDGLGPEWTVYAVIFRDRVETPYISVAFPPSENNPCSTTAQQQMALVLREPVYLLRRRLDKRIEETEKRAEETMKEKCRLDKLLVDIRSSCDNQISKATAELKAAKDNNHTLLEANSRLVKKQNDCDQNEKILAKLREYIGKERYDAILAMGTLCSGEKQNAEA